MSVGNFNIPLSLQNRTRQKIKKEIEDNTRPNSLYNMPPNNCGMHILLK